MAKPVILVFWLERVSAVSWPCSREPSQITRCCRVMYTVEWNCIVFYSKLRKLYPKKNEANSFCAIWGIMGRLGCSGTFLAIWAIGAIVGHFGQFWAIRVYEIG